VERDARQSVAVEPDKAIEACASRSSWERAGWPGRRPEGKPVACPRDRPRQGARPFRARRGQNRRAGRFAVRGLGDKLGSSTFRRGLCRRAAEGRRAGGASCRWSSTGWEGSPARPALGGEPAGAVFVSRSRRRRATRRVHARGGAWERALRRRTAATSATAFPHWS